MNFKPVFQLFVITQTTLGFDVEPATWTSNGRTYFELRTYVNANRDRRWTLTAYNPTSNETIIADSAYLCVSYTPGAISPCPSEETTFTATAAGEVQVCTVEIKAPVDTTIITQLLFKATTNVYVTREFYIANTVGSPKVHVQLY